MRNCSFSAKACAARVRQAHADHRDKSTGPFLDILPLARRCAAACTTLNSVMRGLPMPSTFGGGTPAMPDDLGERAEACQQILGQRLHVAPTAPRGTTPGSSIS